MKTVRIYKDNVREHILKSLFFSDSVLFIGGGLLIALSDFLLFKFGLHFFDLGAYLMTVFLFELGFALIATVKIEGQPLHKLIPRAIVFNITKKKEDLPKLEKTTGDFSVIDGYIRRKNSLIAMYEIEPFDIALLNEEDRDQFYHHIKMMLHTLPGAIQFIAKKEIAVTQDYQKHFFSLYKDSLPTRENLIADYLTDMTDIVNTGKFQVMKYYAILSTKLHSNDEIQFQNAVKLLYDQGARINSSLSQAHVTLHQLSKEELITYCKKQFN